MTGPLILVLIATVCLGSACSASCENEIVVRSPSPDGKRSAVIFSRNRGATVGFNYQVSIVAGGKAPTGVGNVLVVDQAPAYSARFRPVWNGNSSVTVPIPPGARVFTKVNSVAGVGVTFRQF